MSSSLPAGVPSTHEAIAYITPRQPLQSITRPTVPPKPDEILIHVTWTASTPLDLHRADGGLGFKPGQPPHIMGTCYAGTVVGLPLSPSPPSHVQLADKVFGFVQDGEPREAGVQEYITVPSNKVSKLPSNISLQQAVTVPTNLITTFHSVTKDLELELPWPIPQGWTPKEVNSPILIWGAASSVGLYTVQVLRHWGYKNLLAVASGKHHESLKKLGASECFDYNKTKVTEEILEYVERTRKEVGADGPKVPFILDCIGSTEGTLRPLTKIAENGSKVAVMLPVINVHATDDHAPELAMNVTEVKLDWEEGAVLRGVRTFFYAENPFFRDYFHRDIMPTLLEQGVVQPNPQRLVEGATLLERAQNALDLLRSRAPSGEKLVWRVAEE
ncbi:chaperonin 10-like protein [Podospora fimiseda]|uniref:Chaperonin 10-like protein n=1 Tax=Podospora fimiseda TaxID=252190 RepID=A0AAN7BWI2_9PEZI|nr:chaperonin 10-like protein [Podospora fimiseda]